MRKELLIIFLLAIVGIVFSVYFILEPKNTLRYSGLQIYEAIRKYDYLSSRGFDVTAVIKGSDDNGSVELKGKITETLPGTLILYVNGTYRVVEGLMGTKDVRAKEIDFFVSKPISIEMVYPPTDNLVEFLASLSSVDKIKGEFAFTTVELLTPTAIQKIKNLDQTRYVAPYTTVETYPSGFILIIRKPMEASSLSELIMWLDEELHIKNFQTGQLSLYKGVENKSEVAKFEKTDILIRVHEI